MVLTLALQRIQVFSVGNEYVLHSLLVFLFI